MKWNKISIIVDLIFSNISYHYSVCSGFLSKKINLCLKTCKTLIRNTEH